MSVPSIFAVQREHLRMPDPQVVAAGNSMFRFEHYNDDYKGLLVCETFPIARRTAKGCHIIMPFGGKTKFVLTEPGGKRFAHLDPNDALAAFVRRKTRAVAWCKHRLEQQQSALESAKEAIEALASFAHQPLGANPKEAV